MSINEANKMWNLGLHKSMIVSEVREYDTRIPGWKVMRVPGGWIYEGAYHVLHPRRNNSC